MSNYDEKILGQDAAAIVQSFIDEKQLEKWQKHFSNVANVFLCCLDGKGVQLTSFSGKADETAIIEQMIDAEQYQDMLLRVSDSTLEDQAIETTAYPNLRVAVISAKLQGKPVLNWLAYGVLVDGYDTADYENPPLEGFQTILTEAQFIHAVDALRDFTNLLLGYRMSIMTAQAECRRSRSSEKEMSVSLHRTEALTDVVQLLESEDAIETVITNLIEIVSRFLCISGGAVYKIKEEPERVEVVAFWGKGISMVQIPQDGSFKLPDILKADKTVVLSGSSLASAQERKEMEAIGLKAAIVIPVMINHAPGMYVCFGDCSGSRVWQIEEVKFINDSVKILQSILTRRIQKNSLASSYASLERILDNVGSAVYVRDLNTGKILFANSNMRRTFELELKRQMIRDIFEHSIENDKGVCEIYYTKRDRWYDLYYTRMTWVDGSPVLLCALYDITDKKIYQRKIEQQAYTDFLTGLYNRMCCERDLAKFVDLAKKTKDKGLLLYIDLDDFKHINDGLGHQYGDVLLKAISHSLQRIEGIEDTCYRMGGDEFVIILSPAVYEKREQIITNIKDIFLKPWFLRDSDYYCTMSMGIVEFPGEDANVHDLIKMADIAMYEAKKGGKNRIVYYEDCFAASSGKRLDMEKNMREATADSFREFEVYFQPIVDITKEGCPCTGAEALIRWNCAELGFIPPSEFIPLAEYLGLINPIGNYVLYESCKICHTWNMHGYPNYRVNVNLSVVQLLQTDIVEIVQNALKDTGLFPHNLTLEVTESLAIDDMDRMKKILAKIKDLGVRIALDDFGTGYSSLNHIREIPFDVIKVDQSFIRDLDKDSYAKSFVRMVGELAEALGVNLCVEGVETKVQFDILKNMCVDLVQGYYFDRPMPRKQFEEKYLPEMTL